MLSSTDFNWSILEYSVPYFLHCNNTSLLLQSSVLVLPLNRAKIKEYFQVINYVVNYVTGKYCPMETLVKLLAAKAFKFQQ